MESPRDESVPAPADRGNGHGNEDLSRRTFLVSVTAAAAGMTGATVGPVASPAVAEPSHAATAEVHTVAAGTANEVTLSVNGRRRAVTVEPRVTLLDALRERLRMTGTKKGCDRGECGACTVLVDGERIKSCLTLAVMAQGVEVTTVEGLARGDDLHPVQEAFIRHDAFQCGACTPGQIMSAVACIDEGHTGSEAEIREWMSGNLCRCAAYQNIVAAVADAAKEVRR